MSLHKHLHKLSRFNFVKTGVLIAGLAICYGYDRTFFFYPPSLAPAFNSVYLDIVGFLAGMILIVSGIFDIKVDLLVKIGLAVSVAFLTALVVAQFFHVAGLDYFRFHPMILLEIYTIINLMQLAYEYQPLHRE